MRFFFDRNIPAALARMLNHYDRDHEVVYLDERFDPQTPDTRWLADVAKWDPVPVVVSGDGRILQNEAEMQVLAGLPLTVFIFAPAWTNLPWREWAWKAVRIWPSVIDAASPLRPTIYRIPVKSQKIERIGYTADLRR